MYPSAVIPLVDEWKRTWGVRTTRIDSLEALARSWGYDLLVNLIAMNNDITLLFQRWLRDEGPNGWRSALQEPPQETA